MTNNLKPIREFNLIQELNNYNHKKIKQNTMNFRLEQAANQPQMEELFGSYLQRGEISIIAGNTGDGKSTLAVQIADRITRQKGIWNEVNTQKYPIIYYDFEMSDQSLLKRYQSYTFESNFYCPDVSEIIKNSNGVFSIDTIKNDINTFDANIIFIDNITAMSQKSTIDQDSANKLMRGLKTLQSTYNTTICVLAHVPKIPSNVPLHINHVAGSKNIVNFADSVHIIGQSNQLPNRRYLKQVKNRNSEMESQVMVIDLICEDYLHFDFIKMDDERNHIDVDTIMEDNKKNKHIDIANELIGTDAIKYTDFVDNYAKKYNKSIETGKKAIQYLKLHNIIQQNESKEWEVNPDYLI